jgi:hypothetical protein
LASFTDYRLKGLDKGDDSRGPKADLLGLEKEFLIVTLVNSTTLMIWFMAGTTGLEPATSAVTGQRSNQLSYVPKT